MATEKFIESLRFEDNVFELKEDTVLSYLVHYAAPFTGAGEISVPAGTRFAAHGPMRSDAFYMHPVEEDETLLNRMREQENAQYEKLANRLMGFSFYITKEELETLPLTFVCGSRERLVDIFRLICEEQSKPVVYPEQGSTPVFPECSQTAEEPDDLPF